MNYPCLLNSKLKTWWHKRKLKPTPSQEVIDEPDINSQINPWENDYQLLVCEGLFDEYLEMGEFSDILYYCLWFNFRS